MQNTSILMRDFERATTAFQVSPEWYDQYWLKPTIPGSTSENDRPIRLMDFDFHGARARAARERALAQQQACRFLLAVTFAAVRRVLFQLRGSGMRVQRIGKNV